jgi:hypothetical protein
MMKNILGSKNIYRITLQNGRMIGFINNGMFDRGNFEGFRFQSVKKRRA